MVTLCDPIWKVMLRISAMGSVHTFYFLLPMSSTLPALVVLWRRGASSGWPMEEALCEITQGLCRIINKAPWTNST